MAEIAAFIAVAEELHFGRAAQRLHVTTARVSQAIRSLERQAGGTLFERTSRHVSLTPLGQTLLTEFRPAYDRLQHGLRASQRPGLVQEQACTDVLRAGFSRASPVRRPGRRTGRRAGGRSGFTSSSGSGTPRKSRPG